MYEIKISCFIYEFFILNTSKMQQNALKFDANSVVMCILTRKNRGRGEPEYKNGVR